MGLPHFKLVEIPYSELEIGDQILVADRESFPAIAYKDVDGARYEVGKLYVLGIEESTIVQKIVKV